MRPQQRIPKAEGGLLVAVALAAVVIYLPWSHDLTIARVSVFAWAMFAVMLLAPAAGLVLTLLDRGEDDA